MLTTVMLGNKISEARKKMNMSQAQLASELCISSQAVGKWERGESMPDILMLNRLAEILKIDLNYFSELSSEKNNRSVDSSEAIKTANNDTYRKPLFDMSSGNWVDADFSELKNIGEKFSISNIENCRFVSSDLSGLLLKSNNVAGTDFSKSNLNKSQLIASMISNSDFKNCLFKETDISGTYIKNCDFTGVDFTGMDVKLSYFTKNVTTKAIWKQTSFSSSNLTEMVFEGLLEDCVFVNCTFSKVVFQNATLLNCFFKNRSLKKIRFIDCQADKLTYAFLKNGKADLSKVTMITQ